MKHASNLIRHAWALALLLAAFSARAAGLPDTGITTCYNDTATPDSYPATDSVHSVARDGGSHPRQDCRYGRDPATAAGAPKWGTGSKGFDYTKIANDGSPLAANALLGTNPTDWACTQDNITGLMWEVKTPTAGLRYANHTYTWYNSVTTTNGGNAGTAGTGSTCATAGRCDTEQFVADVNALTGANRLCGATDWRLPSQRELLTLALLDGTSPTIDAGYFPNTVAAPYWSASSSVQYPAQAWDVNFVDGNSIGASTKLTSFYVRLVRGGQF
jgi:hypothetical protein